MPGESLRLDRALVERRLVRSRTEAQGLIAAGQVWVDGIVCAKPGGRVTPGQTLDVQGARCPFVSRGGVKLAAALDAFSIAVHGRTALDVGASTGGFSDCLLQRGAACVYAVDVGHGQLAPPLALHPRLNYREGVNARALSPADFSHPFEIIVADLSFISLTLVLPVLPSLLAEGGDVVCLVKPQFEVGAEGLGRGGIVRSEAARQEALASVQDAATRCGLPARAVMNSPLVGTNGNREYLLHLTRAAGEPPGGGE